MAPILNHVVRPLLTKRLAELPVSSTVPKIREIVEETSSIPTVSTTAVSASITKKRCHAVPVPTMSPPDSPALSLPPEVLAFIFKLLNIQDKGRVARVCRSWRDSAKLKKVWRYQTVVVNSNASGKHIYYFLARHGVQKVKLNPAGSSKRWLYLPRTILSALPNLTHLTLGHGTVIRDDIIRQIAHTFTELVLLELNSWGLSQPTDASIGYICNGLKKLEHLKFYLHRRRGGITDAGIKQLATSDLPLRFLGLLKCNSVTGESLRHLSLGKPALEGLELDCKLTGTVASVSYVATMKKVRYLLISMDNYWHNDPQMTSISAMSSLTTLVLHELDDSGMKILSNGDAMIEKLVLDGCTFINDVGLAYVATMPHLRRMAILGCGRLTLAGAVRLIENNRKLTSLEIRRCSLIRSLLLDQIIVNQPNLQWLSLDEQHVDKNSLRSAARQLRDLTVLQVNNKSLLPDLLLSRQ